MTINLSHATCLEPSRLILPQDLDPVSRCATKRFRRAFRAALVAALVGAGSGGN